MKNNFFRIILDNYLYLCENKYIMGKGDRKSKKGKIFSGSFGVVRPRKSKIVVLSTKKELASKKKSTASCMKKLNG